MKTSFSWSNYLKATPANIQYLAMSVKAILATITGTTIIEEAPTWVSVTLLVATVVVEEVGKFAGKVNEEVGKEVIEISYPKEVSKDVDIDVKDKA